MRNLNPEDPVVASAVFGKQVETFLQSDLGAYLLERCAQEEREATERLIETAHTMAIKDILREQSIIERARSFKNWLGWAVQDGLQALQMLEEEQ